LQADGGAMLHARKPAQRPGSSQDKIVFGFGQSTGEWAA